MSEITAIRTQVKDKTRCNIEVDGRYYCGLRLETAMKHRLKVGMSVTDEELAAIQLESEKSVALDQALKKISSSMRSEKEIDDFLREKGYLEEVRNFVIEKMREYGFLDDAAYSLAYVESMEKRKGRRLIALELRRKGVPEQEIESALGTMGSELESSVNLLKKYLRGKELDKKTLQKAYVYLIGKGFEGETAREAIRALGEIDED